MIEMKVISLYTGAGGLDLGLEAAGFETRVAVEMDSASVATLTANRGWSTIHRDIHDVPTEEILRIGELKEGEADLLVGGPPCQPFSKSAYWATGDTRRLKDPRASTLEEFLRVLRDAKPRAFLLENVPGLGYRGKSEGLRLLSRVVGDINKQVGTNYQLSTTVLNAAEYGVPQDRRRLFIIAHREGTEFQFPAPTHVYPDKEQANPLLEPLPSVYTAWDAIGDLENDEDPSLAVTGRWAELLPSIPEGLNYLHHTERGNGVRLFGWRRRYWSFLLKLSKRLPSWTITAQPGPAIGPFHWKSRRLSPLELCRLQTFPAGYEIDGDLRAVQLQLGNAVPSALAERLGLEIRAQFLGDKEAAKRQLSLLPPRRRPVRPPEKPGRVPQKYRKLIGEHEAHPGTGQGPGAKARMPVSSGR
jgi:DNA (cytosine-5)-methyltransferase 1